MIQRRCPKCKTGIMSDMYTSQGWGKEGMYACDSCTHSKSIYEGTTIGPYIFFILFERRQSFIIRVCCLWSYISISNLPYIQSSNA